MTKLPLSTPVTFNFLNYTDKTVRDISEIASARAPKLLVMCDGPCANFSGEADKLVACHATF